MAYVWFGCDPGLRMKKVKVTTAQMLWEQVDYAYDYVLRVQCKGTCTCVRMCMSVHVQVCVDETACRFMEGSGNGGEDLCGEQWVGMKIHVRFSGRRGVHINICICVCVSACRGLTQQSFHRMTSEKPQGHEFGQNKWKASRESEESVNFQRSPGDFCETWISAFGLDKV